MGIKWLCSNFRRGVDKQVIRLMRDRTEGNTMSKVWRQVLESHCEEYLQRKDLYTTLLSQYNEPGKITSKSDYFSFSVEAKTKIVRQWNSAECRQTQQKAFIVIEYISSNATVNSEIEFFHHQWGLYLCIFSLPSGNLSISFQLPPPRAELPSSKLLRKAFLIAEADNRGLPHSNNVHVWKSTKVCEKANMFVCMFYSTLAFLPL